MKECNEFEKSKKFEKEKHTRRIIVCVKSINMHFVLVMWYGVRSQESVCPS